MGLPATIPSPSDGVLDVGPVPLHAYGLLIALGVLAAVWLTGRRMEQRGAGTRDDIGSIAVWAVAAGVIGSRLYSVATEWDAYRDDLGRIPQIWKGGLGIPGGLLAGITVGIWRAKRLGLRPSVIATCAAPALPLAQAIGRWGNWFNQELFGRPTDLPWGLEVSDEKTLAAGYPVGTAFHPAFLYESLWNLALCLVLLWVDRHVRLRPGRLLAVYVAGYGLGRLWIEGLRIDPAEHVAGLRWNQWVAIAAIACAVGYLAIDAMRHRDEAGADDDAGDVAATGVPPEVSP